MRAVGPRLGNACWTRFGSDTPNRPRACPPRLHRPSHSTNLSRAFQSPSIQPTWNVSEALSVNWIPNPIPLGPAEVGHPLGQPPQNGADHPHPPFRTRKGAKRKRLYGIPRPIKHVSSPGLEKGNGNWYTLPTPYGDRLEIRDFNQFGHASLPDHPPPNPYTESLKRRSVGRHSLGKRRSPTQHAEAKRKDPGGKHSRENCTHIQPDTLAGSGRTLDRLQTTASGLELTESLHTNRDRSRAKPRGLVTTFFQYSICLCQDDVGLPVFHTRSKLGLSYVSRMIGA